MQRRSFLGFAGGVLTAGAQTVERRDTFAFAAARWSGPDVRVRVRASRDGVHWGEWQELRGDPHTGSSQLLSFGPGHRFLQIDAASPVEWDFFDPGESPLLRRPLAKDPADPADRPAIVSRAEWGAPEGFRGTPARTTVQHLIVHHTADGPVADAAAWVRAIWRFHVMSNGWSDIGYNFLIAADGTIFEGREGGDNVLGAHFSCQNSGTMGVALLGDFTRVPPAPAALDAVVRLLAWRAAVLQINPHAVLRHAGMRQDLYTISGHRDGNNTPGSCTVTACPGDVFHPLLPRLRNDVNALLTGRWHWTESPGSLWRPETEGVWRYGSERTESYDTGRANSGSIESSPFHVDGRLRLTYESWHQTEDTGRERDLKLLEMSVDHGEWRVIDQVDGVMEQWVERLVDVEVTGRVRLRFRFDSVDEFRNAYTGWRLRNVYRFES